MLIELLFRVWSLVGLRASTYDFDFDRLETGSMETGANGGVDVELV